MRSAIFALAAALICTAASAQSPRGLTPTPQISPALFVVRDHDSTLYLFGTVHALPEGTPWSSPDVISALNSAEEVWTESNFYDEALIQQYSADFTAAVAIPAETSLMSQLTPGQQTRLLLLAKMLGMTRRDLDRLEPWAAGLMLMGLNPDGVTAAAGVDQQVINLATSAGQRRSWLEDASIAEMRALSPQVQIEFLAWVIEEPPQTPTGDDLWSRGDLEGLFDAEIAPMREKYPALYNWILVERNTAWMDKLVAEMNGAGVDFVAVGSAHLAGPDSLNAMFAARGYTVERVGGAAASAHAN
ncbi:MAG: TraB/GumN family protein [Hyphomonadaceae bacterium]